MQLLAARGIEITAHHALPVVVDPERIETDQHAGAFLHRPRLAALADAHQTGFGLYDHYVRRLIDHRLAAAALSVPGIAVVMNRLDAVLGQRRLARRGQANADAGSTESGQDAASIPQDWFRFHRSPLLLHRFGGD